MELEQAQNLALVLITKHGLIQHQYKFKWDNCSRRFGCHHGFKRTISLSRPLTFLNEEKEVRNTILHEIAHALDYVRNNFQRRYSSPDCRQRLVHDSVWQKICMEIGCRPSRCYSEKDAILPTKKERTSKCGRFN